MYEGITANELQQLRNNGMDLMANEIVRLQSCEQRLMVIADWIERVHPEDFKSGLWDAISKV